MKLKLVGEVPELHEGLRALAEDHGFQIADDGMPVDVARSAGNWLQVVVRGGRAAIRFGRTIDFFRAWGHLLQALREGGEREVREECQFTTVGAMPDASQANAVMLPGTVKRLLRRMAVMGLNALMLYLEDGYSVEGEPFFGYLRPRYSAEDLGEIDRYADLFGIEVIPAIQTLAHLKDVLKWGHRYGEVSESEDILLVGEPGTYALIEKMVRAASGPLRTRRIHIGMDEAWLLGRGKYLDRWGVREKHQIMNQHLAEVVKITERCGLHAMMWSDMFFNTPDLKGYGNNYNPEVNISRSVREGVPRSLGLVFWEYNRDDEEFYRKVLRRHREFDRDVLFAGGIWGWEGFGVNYGMTFRTTNAALSACKKEEVREVFATMWGDDGTESNIFAHLLGMQLYAEHAYAREPDPRKLKERFASCTGADAGDFMSMRLLDEVPGVKTDNMGMCNPSKYLLWQNILLGLFDANVEGLGLARHYGALRESMKEAATRNGAFGYVFDLLERVCAVLEIKSEIGLDITRAYRAGDLAALRDLAEKALPELSRRAAALRELHRDTWFATYQPAGWEVLDLRYGALSTGVDTAIKRILDYLEGKVRNIGELEEQRLRYPAVAELPAVYHYSRMVSASRLSQ